MKLRKLGNYDNQINICIVSYHARCFANPLKELATVHVGNKRVNGTIGNTCAILSIIFFSSYYFWFYYKHYLKSIYSKKIMFVEYHILNVYQMKNEVNILDAILY